MKTRISLVLYAGAALIMAGTAQAQTADSSSKAGNFPAIAPAPDARGDKSRNLFDIDRLLKRRMDQEQVAPMDPEQPVFFPKPKVNPNPPVNPGHSMSVPKLGLHPDQVGTVDPDQPIFVPKPHGPMQQ